MTDATLTPKATEGRILAAIDIGTNSIRLQIGQLLSDGSIEVLEKAHRTVRLGQDSFRQGRLEPETMQAAVSILREFKRTIDLYKAQAVWTVGTSALREARNADVFCDRVLLATGLIVDIIDGSQEGRLTVSAVRAALNDKPPSLGAHTLICEVGGGGTMITMLERGHIEMSHSLGLGAIRLREFIAPADWASGLANDLIENEIEATLNALEGLMPLKTIRTFFIIGSDARFAAARVGKKLPNPKFSAISVKSFDRLVETIRPMSLQELISHYGLTYNEAETIPTALMIYQKLLHKTSAKRLIAASVTMRDGLLLELARRCLNQDDPSFAKEVVQSATSIAEKYKVNLEHAQRVAAGAVRLFDVLSKEHGLSSRHRVLLQVAALLHETGLFVGARGYHKHTYYLVANSDIYGLNRQEVQIVANVARYHRRSAPKPTHIEYMTLPQEARIVVNKLAALLRLAKALDISEIRSPQQVNFRLTQDKLVIAVSGLADSTLRKQLLESRNDMFEHVFGLQLEFEGV